VPGFGHPKLHLALLHDSSVYIIAAQDLPARLFLQKKRDGGAD
jgi:hypothetical protein